MVNKVFTKMTDEAKLEALDILQEECAELIQIASKMIRFGEMNTNEGKLPTVRYRFMHEVGDVMAMISIVCAQYNITTPELDIAMEQKFTKLRKYSNILEEDTLAKTSNVI